MAMTLIAARERATDYLYRVHLDTSKIVDGQPDPAYVMEFTWGRSRPGGMTKPQHLSQIQAEVKAIALEKLAALQASSAGTALPAEGTTL